MGLIELATRNRRQKQEFKRQKAEAEAIDAKRRNIYSDTSARNPYAQGNYGPYGQAKQSLVDREDTIAKSSGLKPPGLSDSGLSSAQAMCSASRYPAPPSVGTSVHSSRPASWPSYKDGAAEPPAVFQGYPTEHVESSEQETQFILDDEQRPTFESGGLPSYDDIEPPEFQTEEEQEEQDVESMKQDIRFAKQDTVASTRNAMQSAQRAEQIGNDTLTRIGIQGERIHNAEMNIDLTETQNKIGRDSTLELERQNRSMFALLAPSTKKSRAKEEMRILDRHQQEREQRQQTRGEAYRSNRRMDTHFRELGKASNPLDAQKSSSVQRSKYQFEADSEDEGMEGEIDKNLDALGFATGRLNKLAIATGVEMGMQDEHLNRIMDKVWFLPTLLLFQDSPRHT